MIAQKCDTNKNVTKMGVIIKENYYIQIWLSLSNL
jgi:hypothetical protein